MLGRRLILLLISAANLVLSVPKAEFGGVNDLVPFVNHCAFSEVPDVFTVRCKLTRIGRLEVTLNEVLVAIGILDGKPINLS